MIRAISMFLIGATLACSVAQADITLEQSVSIEGVGIMSAGNMSGTTKTTIAGDRSRTDSDLQLKSRFVRMLARGAAGPTAQIVRLDQDKIYHLDINKKRYTEMTFEQMRDQLKKATDQMSQSESKQQQTPSAIDESQCEWLPPKVEFKKTGEKAQFAGYDAERITITAAQPCKDKKTGSICEIALGLEEWLASGFTEGAEAQKFHKAYAQKMGLDASASQDITQRARAMFARYQGVWSEIASKMQGVKGYPVKSSFTLALGGEQCQNANAKQDTGGDSANTSSGGGLAGQIGGKLGSLFHRKKDDDATAATPATPPPSPPPVPPGDVALMTVTSQLVSVSTSAASPEAFEIPAGFTKEDSPH